MKRRIEVQKNNLSEIIILLHNKRTTVAEALPLNKDRGMLQTMDRPIFAFNRIALIKKLKK